MTETALPEGLAPLAPLLGSWAGTGRGIYPTIDDFVYEEEVRFWHVGRPILLYQQRTWRPDTKAPLHSEMGYWRALEGERVEVVLAHGFGAAEVLEGALRGRRIELTSTSVVSTGSAKRIDATARSITIEGERLSYEVRMAYGGHELQAHLNAELERVQ